jgi:hypothetical protein
MTPEQYAQEFECEFEVPALGAIYAKELAQAKESGRICAVPHQPERLVDTAWDLGIGDATAIWFYQVTPGEIHVIDYYEASGQPITHYLSRLASRPYQYGKHHVPHDATARELGTGKSLSELMQGAGYWPTVLPRLGLEHGINAARLMFSRCWFDEVKCGPGLEALMNYRRGMNNRLGEFRNEPVHDWASHGADAFRYMAIARNEAPQKAKPIKYPRLGVA